MCDHAVEALLKCGDVKAAVDACVTLNQWDKAVQLAEEYNFPQIEGILSKYASSMLEQDNRLEAIELYCKANKSPQAAKLLSTLADEMLKAKKDIVLAKKLYVLVGLELERFKSGLSPRQLLSGRQRHRQPPPLWTTSCSMIRRLAPARAWMLLGVARRLSTFCSWRSGSSTPVKSSRR